ncbi:di-heme-cytochrome C peroxidase [Bradyrhizobium sp.]|uniref:di-heme-cytochrome C peroxidase n=1 Tax=Bradyrhizobium sp. TaxID=376 RepID=UPI0023981146|nr:di-heme-cytochrome C peroxidase [Bradyrhizobium sp.]MDE2376976.1 cytochrome C [Bradyrhizobium sp.]
MDDPRTLPLDPPLDVSPSNPCPFLRALVAEGFVDGGTVPLGTLSRTIGAATGEKGLKKIQAKILIYLVALIANGLNPLRVAKSWWSGAQLDGLRKGPLDKHGAGSRILDVHGQVTEDEIKRLADFGRAYPDPSGGTEQGLNATEIEAFMAANRARDADNWRWYYPLLMMNEWPVLLKIMGKGEDANRYLSVAEVRTLFVQRKFPLRIAQRMMPQPATSCLRRVVGVIAAFAVAVAALALLALVAVAEFPNQLRAALPEKLAELLPPPLPRVPPVRAAYWLDQGWSLEDRHWFHHVSQGTATFPVPYTWFMALEQPRIRLLSKPGLLKDDGYLERFGFIPSPRSIHTDDTVLRRFGYAHAYQTKPQPADSKLWKTPVENVDGLPIGFARMTGVVDPATGRREEDRIGLTCAACHTGQIHYKGVDIRFDGGPAMTDLKKLEAVTGLAIGYTLKVPFRFRRFADRVLGPGASDTERSELEQRLGEIGKFLLDWQNSYKKVIRDKQQAETEEGFGRLDALNRIGNQVFSQDLALSGVPGFEKNMHAQDAPVSYPPVWTVPWLKYAQYDASIEQPLIRNAGEALGVTALLNLSNDSSDKLFRSSVNFENLRWIEKLIAGPDPYAGKKLGGLTSPQWPSQLFADEAWKIKPDLVKKGRALYAQICVECHLGPVTDDAFDEQYRDKSVWTAPPWEQIGDTMVLNPVQKSAKGMGTDSAQADVLTARTVKVPRFFDVNPSRDLAKWWECKNLPETSSTDMPYSLALMTVVDRVARKWMQDARIPEPEQAEWWGPRKNCPDPGPDQTDHPERAPWYRARPLNGVWATAPYLHNGSVPSLYWLLKPAAERPKSFCMGRRDFDPEKVGFAVTDGETCKTGETRFSAVTSDGQPIHGNSVSGHSFEGPKGGPYKNGVIGGEFTDEERDALIEYLKTL